MGKKENKIQTAIKDFINSLDRGKCIVKHSHAMTGSGDPDLDACIKGRCVKIEVKQPGEKARKIQMQKIREWQDAGAVAFVAVSLENVREHLLGEGLLSEEEYSDG